MREVMLDTVEGKDLLKPYPFIGLIPLPCRKVTARIPLQSENAQKAFSDSFPRGKRYCAPLGRSAANGRRIVPKLKTIYCSFVSQA